MKKIKNLKPNTLDVNLKYRCPECGAEHWSSLLEAKTKEFVIVCYCGTILKPKIISNINIEYTTAETKSKQAAVVKPSNTDQLDKDQLQTAIKTLVTYGFTNNEAKDLVSKTLESHLITNVSDLVKTCLTNFGVQNDQRN